MPVHRTGFFYAHGCTVCRGAKDNGMNPLHLITGLTMSQNGVSINHLKSGADST